MQISLSIWTAYKETATENEQFTNTVKVKLKYLKRHRKIWKKFVLLTFW